MRPGYITAHHSSCQINRLNRHNVKTHNFMYYLVSFSSIAKARTVRTFPRASSATAVALATCSCAIRDKFRRIEPKTVPPRITTGNVAINSTVSLGEIMYKEMTQPTVWVVLRKPWDTHCLKALLKS